MKTVLLPIMDNVNGLIATKSNPEEKGDEALSLNDTLIESEPIQPVMRGIDFVPQLLACLAATSTSIHTGINLAFSAILLPELMTSKSVLPITKDQASWIASIVTISTTIGSILSGPLMDRFGRKTVCKLTCFPLLMSWIIIAFIKNIPAIYVGRLLAGFGAGLSTASIVYVSEVSHPKWRPALLCLISVYVSLGILLTFVMCLWLTYDQMALCFAVMSLASYLTTCPLPESPTWLVRYRTEMMAKNALRWLNRRDEFFQYQLTCLMDNLKCSSASTSKPKSFTEYYTAYKERSTIRPIIILLFIFVFQQISGAYVIIFYAVNILRIAGGTLGTSVSEYGALVTLGLIRFVVSIFTALLSRKCGRRPVWIVSGIGMAVSMLVAAICINKGGDVGNLFISATNYSEPYSLDLHTSSTANDDLLSRSLDDKLTNTTEVDISRENMNENSSSIHLREMSATVQFTMLNIQTNLKNQDLTMNFSSNSSEIFNSERAADDQWLPIVCVIVYVLFSSVGVLVIPWTLIGELLPTSVRGSCGGLMMAFAYITMFIVIKMFPYVLQVVKVRGIFYIFSATSLSGVLFVYFGLPETRGKSFQEIEAHFN